MTQFDPNGFLVELKDYVTLKDGRPTVVEKVPFCIDPKTQEEFLHVSVYEELWKILHSSTPPIRHITGDVFQMPSFESELKNA